MTEVRVGDVRKTRASREIYVITNIDGGMDCGIFQDGRTFCYDSIEYDEKAEFIAHYDTWQEAIASKEFKGENS